MHGIYELSRGFLSEHNKADAQRNFRILSDLDPVFGPTVDMLFIKELDRLRTGAAVIPVLDDLNRASVKYQVNKMAAGRIEPEGVEFIKRREANIDRAHPLYVDHQLQQSRAAVAAGTPRLKTFDEVLATFDALVPKFIRQRLGNQVTQLEAAEIHARLDTFVALRSAVRADLYLWAISLMHDAGWARDKTDDYRHVIEASYAELFITGDEQLARTAPRLHPQLQILTWGQLEAG